MTATEWDLSEVRAAVHNTHAEDGDDPAGCGKCRDVVERVVRATVDAACRETATVALQVADRRVADVVAAVEAVLSANERHNSMVETVTLRRRIRKALAPFQGDS